MTASVAESERFEPVGSFGPDRLVDDLLLPDLRTSSLPNSTFRGRCCLEPVLSSLVFMLSTHRRLGRAAPYVTVRVSSYAPKQQTMKLGR